MASKDKRRPAASNKKRTLCVFCGKEPIDKNREHILPKWLMALTGDLHRPVWLGQDFRTGKGRVFSYSSLTAPSCTKCNEKYANLEGRVKPVMLSVLAEAPISRDEFNVLLDWFDKVRIGMWLLYYHLDGNMAGVDPLFHIDQRLGTQDRMLIISKASDVVPDLTYRGVNSPSFYYTPSCFSLMVNQYLFTNISYPLLFSKSLGMPWSVKSALNVEGMLLHSISPGTEVIATPILAERSLLPCTILYQPMWAGFVGSSVEQLYNTHYCREGALDPSSGVGAIFLENGDGIAALSSEPTIDWVPPVGPNTDASRYLQSKTTLKLQNYIDSLLPNLSALSEEQREHYKEVQLTNRAHNDKTMDELTRRWLQHILDPTSTPVKKITI